MESQDPEDQSRADRLAMARALLEPVHKSDAAWPALAAAGFFAICAMAFAVTAIMTPAQDYAPMVGQNGDKTR